MVRKLTVEEILTILSGTTSRLAELSDGLTPEQLKTPPSPDEWPARDILAHLLSCCDMWGSHIYRMLNEDAPIWKGINPRTWIKSTDYLEQDFATLQASFDKQRAELLDVLQALPPEAWLRTGTATGYGQRYAREVHREADGLARHERAHLKQMQRAVEALRTQPRRQGV